MAEIGLGVWGRTCVKGKGGRTEYVALEKSDILSVEGDK